MVRIPRRPQPATTESQRRAAQNLLDALGGPPPVIEALRLSGKSKAVQLADVMSSTPHENISFHHKLTQVGMNIVQFTELLLDVQQAKVVARLVMSSGEVAESILSRATDQFRPHHACMQSGRMLHEESGLPTDVECYGCQGTGWILESAEREWVELYLELVKLRKTNPAVDMSRKITQNNLNVFGGDLSSGDGAPSIDAIIKRADQQTLPPPSRTLGAGIETVPVMMGMPEDSVDVDENSVAIEAEVVV